jgi:hypothetical protein
MERTDEQGRDWMDLIVFCADFVVYTAVSNLLEYSAYYSHRSRSVLLARSLRFRVIVVRRK